MENLVVNLEVAKLADQLGFREETLYTYIDCECQEGNLSLETVWEYTGKFFADSDDVENARSNDYECYLAPFRSQLQKWLREVHNIYVFVIPYPHPDENNKSVLFEVTWTNHHTTWSGCISYEEALEQGLLESLKLINNEV